MTINLNTKPLIILLGAFVFFNACKKKSDNLVLPDQVSANGAEPNSDSLTLKTSSIKEDSFETDQLPYMLLGAMNDPNYGLSKSEVYSQFTITDLNPSLNAAGNTLDSAVLTIRFTSSAAFYGNLLTPQTFTVHRLTEDFPAAGNRIYNSKTLSFDPSPIGTFTGVVSLTDSTKVRIGKSQLNIAPSLKIKLSSAFANDIFNAPTGTFASDDVFKTFLKGVVIKASSTPTSGDGAIIALTLNDALSKITIHYNDSLQYNLSMKSSRAFANYQIVNQSSAIVNQQSNPNLDYSVVYAQSLTGSKIKVEITNLENLAKNKTKIIHKAELIVKPLNGSFNSTYPLPQRLLVLQPDSFGKSIAIPDLFNGKFIGDLRSNNSYVLNITDFIQFQLNTYKTTGSLQNVLHIVVPNSNPIAPSRISVDADKTTGQEKIALRIIYSEL
jgi:hypothetical protein